MNSQDGNFTKLKRWMIGLSGVLVAICSLILTKQGVGIGGELAWMGTAVAFALFCAELMFNSNFDELNWTIIVLGLGAYFYSIWTNIEGLYFYRTIEGNLLSNFDITNFGGGLFIDVYPELAIAWALKESKIGDLFGNFVKTLQNPDKLTEPVKKTQQVPQVIREQHQSRPQEHQEPRPAPKPITRPNPSEIPEFIQKRSQEHRKEPTYHPISYQGADRGDK